VQPSAQQGGSFTMMEFETPQPMQPSAGSQSFTMMEMESVPQYGQTGGQGGQADSFTMMEFQSVSGSVTAANLKKKASPLKVVALIVSLILYIGAVAVTIYLASGAFVN
jgi:hypothetical protein